LLRGPAYHLYELDLVFEDPLANKDACEREQLNLLLKDEHQVVRGDEEIRAVDALVDFFVRFILHVERVICLNRVDYNLFGQLHCQTVFVDSNLFDVVAAPNFDSRFSNQMLNYHISH
jgi:hypothetical protein